MQTWIVWQHGWVQVDDAPFIIIQNRWPDDPHVAGHGNKIDPVFMKHLEDLLLICLLAATRLDRKSHDWSVELLSPLDHGSVWMVAEEQGQLARQVARLKAFGQSFIIGTVA